MTVQEIRLTIEDEIKRYNALVNHYGYDQEWLSKLAILDDLHYRLFGDKPENEGRI
jgi:hypothetical protein